MGKVSLQGRARLFYVNPGKGFEAKMRKDQQKRLSFLSSMASYLALMQCELSKALVISHIVRVREKM